MTVEEEVAAVKARVAAAHRNQAGARQALGIAQAQVREAATALQGEFGVTSLEQARELQHDLRERLDVELLTVQQELAKVEASA
jgi:inner membrane protein involved in colicin E2 resistance